MSRGLQMSPSLAMLSLTAAMALGGANVAFGKALMVEIPVATLLALRFALATAALALIAPFEPGPPLRSLSLRQWSAVAVLGVVGSLLFTFFLLEGVKRTSAADAGIITATLPAVVTALGILRGERPGAGGLAMIGLAVAGVALIQVAAVAAGPSALVGNLLIGVAVVCEAIFVLVSKGISRVLPPLRLSLAVSLVGMLFCLPLVPSLFNGTLSGLGAGTWTLVLWYIAAASIVCTVLWYRGVPYVPTWRAGLATAALPVAALAVSALYLREAIGATQLLGAGLVIAAIVIGTWPGRAR